MMLNTFLGIWGKCAIKVQKFEDCEEALAYT